MSRSEIRASNASVCVVFQVPIFISHPTSSCIKLVTVTIKLSVIHVRDLSEISRGRGEGVETEGGSQLFETQKREGS